MLQESIAADSTARSQTTKSEESLRGLALRCMREAKWNTDLAKSILLAAIESDSALCAEAIEVACDQLLEGIQCTQRGRLLPSVAAGVDDTSALRRAAESLMLETYIVLGRIRLGDATPDELRRAISLRKTSAKTLERHATFLTAVLKRLKPTTKCVRDELREDDVKQVARKCGL